MKRKIVYFRGTKIQTISNSEIPYQINLFSKQGRVIGFAYVCEILYKELEENPNIRVKEIELEFIAKFDTIVRELDKLFNRNSTMWNPFNSTETASNYVIVEYKSQRFKVYKGYIRYEPRK